MTKVVFIFLIYFCQFYITLFEQIFHFNCEKEKYGKCIIDNFVEKNSELYLIDEFKIKKDYNNQYYKNNFNDSYFNTENNNKANDIKEVNIVETVENLNNNNNNNNNKNLKRKESIKNPPITTRIVNISTNLKK